MFLPPLTLVPEKQASTPFTHGGDRTAFIDSKRKSLTPTHSQVPRQKEANSPRPIDLRPREQLLHFLTKLLPSTPCSSLWLPGVTVCNRNTYFQLFFCVCVCLGGKGCVGRGELYIRTILNEQGISILSYHTLS